MKMKFENGTIDYRLPNILEALKLMNKIKGSQGQEELEIISDMLLLIGPFIEEIKYNKKKITYEEALKDLSLLKPLIDLATEIMNCFNFDDKKKV